MSVLTHPAGAALWLAAACAFSGCAGMADLMPFSAAERKAGAEAPMEAEAQGTTVAPGPARDVAPGEASFADDEDGGRLLAKLDLDEQPRGPGQGGPGNQGQGGAQGGAPVPPMPLLIYTAEIYLAVYEVAPTQKAVIQHARELGGYLARQSDQEVVVRVPAHRFTDALERVEKLGDVLHRDVQAQDVSEEYRDLSIRLRNAEVVRARLEGLLEQAKNVEDALAVQRELAKVTETIETMKGRLRFLQDRIAFSTITVRFSPREREPVGAPDVYRLPFPWLDELGLHSLLNLR